MTIGRQTSGSPAEIDALFDLAARQRHEGRSAEAEATYRQILAARPDIAEAHYNLGNMLASAGKFDEAVAHYERAAALKPDFAEAHNNLGNLLAHQGKFDEAAARFEQALALRPEFAETYYNLGNALLAKGHFAEAADKYEQAVALKPDDFQVFNNLGNALKQQGKLDQAVANYEQSLVLKPDFIAAHYNLGNALKQQGKLDQAIVSFGRALAINPHFSDAYHSLGTALSEQGKLDEAATCYDRALSLQPDYAEVHYHRAELTTFRAGDADLAALEMLAADPESLPPSKMLYIHFALGKALEDVGDYPRAFGHWLQGNAMKRREVNYYEAGFQRIYRLIADTFDAALFDRFQGVGNPSSVPIFIVGMPRSGTTLIEQILASHPEVHAAGELTNLGRVVELASGSVGRSVPFPAWIPALDADAFWQLGQAYLASLPTPPEGKTRVTDKLPKNLMFIGLIRLILPNARIIHTVRSPADTCLSCFSKLFDDLPFTYDLAELGRYYREYYQLMAHWRSVLPAEAMLDVSYEDVVDDLEGQARRLVDFCGLPWDDRCLNFHETSRPIATSSNVQVRRPLYRSSLARWRRYEAFLQPLLAELEDCR